MKKAAAVMLGGLALAACGTQQITPVSMQDEKRVCIIKNPRVIHDFHGALQRAIEERGYKVEFVPETSQNSVCPVTARYTGNYRWDLWVYLAYAEIQVFRNGQPAGRAMYNARSSRPNTESKVKELVAELFRT